MSDSRESPHAAHPNMDEHLSGLFAQFVLQQANLAMMLLGRTPHPQTGQVLQDMDGARMFIEQLEMIEAKTRGNLSKEEETLLKQSLMSLHLAFVEAVDASQRSAPASKPAESTPKEPARAPEPVRSDAAEGPSSEAPASDPDSKKKFSKKY